MDIMDYFSPADVGSHLDDLQTPVPIIDVEVVDRNIRRWQARCDQIGIGNRPHIKTHKLKGLAQFQIAAGAQGITVQKLGEAEVMADAGIDDMLLTFNVVGHPKLGRLAALLERVDITLVADSLDVVEGLAQVGTSAGRDIRVLVECDTGAGRNGVQSPAAAVDLAKAIDKTPGVQAVGLMTYPRPGMRAEAAAFLAEARAQAADSGLRLDIVSTGGSPEMWDDTGLADITEYRAGTYVYFDRSLVMRETCAWYECALTVLSTVVSRPNKSRAIIDAGSKALTMDLLGLDGYGFIQSLPDARIYDLNEEHGYVDVSEVDAPVRVGDLVCVTPNHVCPVSNLFDQVVLTRGSEVIGAVQVDARGTVQ